MPIRKPVPAILPWLTALAASPLVLIVAAIAATRFGGVDLSVGYDLLTWTVARTLAWIGLAAGLVAVVLALRDIRGRGGYALAALVFAGAAVVGFIERQGRDATPKPRDVTTNVEEPPAFSRAVAALHRGSTPAACEAVVAIPSQVLAQQATSALVDAGFVVNRATTFEVEAAHEGAWFGFVSDAVVRIRPGRTDIRVAARDARPDGGATCRLAARIAGELAAAR
ncbi:MULTISPECIES: DUF1499 domain-containing protein [unclassified Brevundimonas]|uniref:DUF1499 domain-containing protein n=1 Tax=unclassified Brevundimonas TaxID=2622653 RepID=UPI002005F203|nr:MULTISPECIES: DUF1499 domain-containing protein [unclassified Brevundimonas]MCK6103393.1 DUF1499 domain-containing protein [Brevundimonas sp. EYE_349]